MELALRTSEYHRSRLGPFVRAGLLLSAGRRTAGDLDRQRRRLGEKDALDGKVVDHRSIPPAETHPWRHLV